MVSSVASSLRRLTASASSLRGVHIDASAAMLADPYRFISARCRRARVDAFETRLLLKPTFCITGKEGAAVFYDPARFVRAEAAPHRLVQTLFGKGAVQSLDGEAHRQRKAQLLATLDDAGVARLDAFVKTAWERTLPTWRGRRVVLYDEARRVLTAAVCAWAGVPLVAAEMPLRKQQLSALYDGAGALGPRHWRARRARTHATAWLADVVRDVRAGRVAAAGAPLALLAAARGDDGATLPPELAATELLNLLRPTVAIAVYVALLGHALFTRPAERAALLADDDAAERFVQEVRRFYPFFPFAAARVKRDFEWGGVRFREGTRTLFDLYGTNHDPRVWQDPEVFRPERFRGRVLGPFDLVAQGGGDTATGHRCAGERATIALMKTAARILAAADVQLAEGQDVGIDMRRLPALPRSGLVLEARR